MILTQRFWLILAAFLALLACYFVIAPAVSEGGIVASWELEDGSGTTATDSSGNGYHGVLEDYPDDEDLPQWEVTPDIAGTYGVRFNSTAQLIDVDTAPSGADLRSIAVWFNVSTSTQSGNPVLAGHCRPALRSYGWGMFLDSGQYVSCFAAYNNINWVNNLRADISGYGVNTWIHAVFTIPNTDGSSQTGRLYLQGQEVDNYTSTASYHNYGFGIGQSGYRPWETASFNGRIGSVTCWDTVLTAEEVNTLYNEGLARINIESPSTGAEIDRDVDKPSGKFSFVAGSPTTSASFSCHSINESGVPANDEFDILLEDAESNVFSLFLNAQGTPYYNDTLEIADAAIPGDASLNVTNATTSSYKTISIKDTYNTITLQDPSTGTDKLVFAEGDGVKIFVRVRDWEDDAVLSSASVYCEVYLSSTMTLIYNNSGDPLTEGSDAAGSYYSSSISLTNISTGRYVVFIYSLTSGNISDGLNSTYFWAVSTGSDAFRLEVHHGLQYSSSEDLVVYTTIKNATEEDVTGVEMFYQIHNLGTVVKTGALSEYSSGHFYQTIPLSALESSTYILEITAHNNTHNATHYSVFTITTPSVASSGAGGSDSKTINNITRFMTDNSVIVVMLLFIVILLSIGIVLDKIE